MKKMIHCLKKGAVALFALLLIFTVFSERIDAAGPDLADYEDSYEVKTFSYFGFDKSTLETDDLTTSPKAPKDKNTPEYYEARYPDSLDYFGQTLSVKVNVTFEGANKYGYNNSDTTSIWRSGNSGSPARKQNSVWIKAFGADFTVTISLFKDSSFTTPFNDYEGAVAFVDPDQSNYIMDIAGREIYYQNIGNLGSKYTVESDGLYRKSFGDIADAELGVTMKGSNSITFRINGYADWIYLPDFIVIEAPYIVEYYYQNNDGTYPEKPNGGTSETRYCKVYEDSVVTVTDEDKTSQRDGYGLDESMNAEWSKEFNPDGSTVLKVYFKPSYTIKYDGNGGTLIPGKTMDDDNYYAEEPTMPSKETWNYERPGFEFVGFKLENEGETYNGSKDYRDTLLAEEDRVITLYAQWNPLDYKIKYDPNGGEGVMADDDYTGLDETMPSKEEWTFTRKGYKFVGYRVENVGDMFNGKNEYKPDLLVDEDRVITLYAQWEELPYTIKYDPNGGKGEMANDEYMGSATTMPSKEDWTFTRDGYDFTGFKFENVGDTLNGSKEYKDTLLDDEDRVITLYAQWEPWKYTIKYDPNGGTGEMPDHIYYYDDPDMNSDPNQYKRSGYTFTGFLYTDELGNQTLYKSINDFRAELVRLGKNSEILLVAQWRKNPLPTKNTIPVTGVEYNKIVD